MRGFLIIGALLLSQVASAEGYWSCQCFESKYSTETFGGVEVPSEAPMTLNAAQTVAMRVCKVSPKSKPIVNCLRLMKADQ